MRLILVRHGETEENVNEIMQGHLPGKLTSKGMKQAIDVSNRLKDEKIDFIYCSDLARAKDTAKEIIKFHPDTGVEYTNELRERNMGEYEGRKHNENDYDKDPIGGESLIEFKKRVMDFFRKTIDKHNDENILYVFHGGPIGMLISEINKVDYNDLMKSKELKNANITIIETDKNKNAKIHILNCTKHIK